MKTQYRRHRIEIYFEFNEVDLVRKICEKLEKLFMYFSDYIEEPEDCNRKGLRIMSASSFESVKELKDDYFEARKGVLNK